MVLLPPRAGGVRRASTSYVHAPPRLGRLPRRRHRAGAEPRCARRRIDAEVVPRPRHYYSIWKDTVAGGHPVPLRPAPHRGHRRRRRDRLLRRARRDAQHVAAGARPVQGLHRLAEEQPLPLAAHHRDRPGRPLGRGADPHRGDAPRRRVRHRRRLPRTRRAGRRGSGPRRPRPSSSAWLRRRARLASSAAADPAQFLESLRCDLAEAQIQVFADGRQRCCCRPAPPRSTWPTSSSPTSGDRCVAATVNGQLAPLSLAAGRRRRGRDLHPDRARDGRPRRRAGRPVAGVARLRQVAPGPAADQPLASAEHRAQPGRHDRRQGPPRPGRDRPGAAPARPRPGQRRAAAPARRELGYPDLETLLVAVADHNLTADGPVVEQLIARVDDATASPAVAAVRDRGRSRSLVRRVTHRRRRTRCAVAYRVFYRLPGAGAPAAGPAGRCRKYIVGAVALVRDAEPPEPGRLLLLRQPPGRGWSLPAGLLRRGETPGRRRAPGSWPRRPASRLDPERPRRPAVPNAIVHTDGRWVDMVFEARVPASTTTLAVDGAEVLEAAWHPARRPAAADRADRPAARRTTASGRTRTTPMRARPMSGICAVRAGRRRGPPAAAADRARCPRRCARSATSPLLDRALARLAGLGLTGRPTSRSTPATWPTRSSPTSATGPTSRVEPGRPAGHRRRRRPPARLDRRPGVLVGNADAYLAPAAPGTTSPPLLDGWDGETVRMLGVPAGATPAEFGGHRFAGFSLLPWRRAARRCRPSRPTWCARSGARPSAAGRLD